MTSQSIATGTDHLLAELDNGVLTLTMNRPEARNAIILFGGGQIYEMGMPLCNRIELTVIAANPDVGPDAALFPAIDERAWERVTEAEFAASETMPGYRYDRMTRKKPVFV